MSLFEKVKDFFYDEEYEEEIEAPIKEEKKHKKEKIKITEKIEKPKLKKEKLNEEISERELFKAERTFNFPMDIEDDEEFTSIKNKKEEKPIIVEEKKTISKPIEEKTQTYTGIRMYAKKEEVQEETKKFSPSPVISPIYGILDKNYKKEDLIIDSVKEEPSKTLDYDSVRKRAYSDIYVEKEDNNDLFYNLEEKEDDKEENNDVKIIYNDVSLDEEEDKNVSIGQKIEEYERQTKEDDVDFEDDDDSQILSETKEQDLFNLIDNMYNSDEEDEEEE